MALRVRRSRHRWNRQGQSEHQQAEQISSGYYWVSTYQKGGMLTGIKVRGHCRKARSIESQEEQIRKENGRCMEMKHQFKMLSREIKERIKEDKIKAEA